MGHDNTSWPIFIVVYQIICQIQVANMQSDDFVDIYRSREGKISLWDVGLRPVSLNRFWRSLGG